jgi:hypothetical protein
VNAVCLLIAGTLRAVIPTQEFTVAWMHSVEKIRWEERYRVEGDTLRLFQARIQGSGAGIDPPPDAKLHDGWWSWRPSTGPLPALRLTLSSYTKGYDLCWRGRCQSLQRLVAASPRTDRKLARGDEGEVVEIRACRKRHHE